MSDVVKNIDAALKLYCNWYNTGPREDAGNIAYDLYCVLAGVKDSVVDLATERNQLRDENIRLRAELAGAIPTHHKQYENTTSMGDE